MAHIYQVQIGGNFYLIEPRIYVESSATNTVIENIATVYAANINGYTPFPGTILFLKVHATNTGAAALKLNDDSLYPIQYNGSNLLANDLIQGQTYMLNYHADVNPYWEVLNTLSRGAASADEFVIGTQHISFGDEINLNTLRTDLSLSNALHFVGIATNNTLQDGSTKDPFSSATDDNIPNYTGQAGDVVIDSQSKYEYIWVVSTGETGHWELLGGDQSYKIIQTPVTSSPSTQGNNQWISSFKQNANGEIYEIQYTSLDTGGTWTGIANKANSLNSAREIHVDLASIYSSGVNEATFDGTTNVTLPISGTLDIGHGGTNNSTYIECGILYGQTIHQTGGNSYNIYAPSNNALLINFIDNNNQRQTILELGKYDENGANDNSEGRINLFSSGEESHIIKTTSVSSETTHILPAVSGIFVQIPNNAEVENNNQNTGVGHMYYQSVYVNANGTVQALIYTPNKIYYGYNNSQFGPSDHYIDNNKIAINSSGAWPRDSNNVDINATLYVNGKTIITNDLQVDGDSKLTGKVGIGCDPDVNRILHIAGSILISNNQNNVQNDVACIDVSRTQQEQDEIHFYPTVTGTLGLASDGNNLVNKRWSAVYIGTADTYGDAYTPIFWNNGVPTLVNLVQKIPFTINNGNKSVTISGNTLTDKSIVTNIIIEQGESFLCAPLSWLSGNNYIAINTNLSVTGTINGYILVIRGEEIGQSNSFTYTQSTSIVSSNT